MISKLILPSLTSFGAQESGSSVRSQYRTAMDRNAQIAANANNAVMNSIQNTSPGKTNSTQMPMMGNAGKKLDVIA